ncbi:TPA: hypothetical protein HA265_06410 [Candidatus Woesearchaeota archaeon]|nr:hypothetical protein [Candidatus Woesearchaeota archaeon]
MKDIIKRLELGVEEFILAFLIIIEVLDFLTIIPAPVEFVEKVIAIVAMCYLFYHASLTRIIFGQKKRLYDLMIVISYLLLSVKTIIGFLVSAIFSAHEEGSVMTSFYSLVINNADILEKAGFWIGGLLIILLAILLTNKNVKKPSILSMIHEEKKTDNAWQKVVHFFSIYLVLIAIFVVVFTFAIEWFAITVDAPILMIILFSYIYIIVKRGKGIKTESFLKKVGESSEKFYERFISMFHSRKTIMIAITGLLVIHLLVDIGHFIIPYTTGLLYPWYFEQLGAGHLPLSELVANDFALAGSIATKMGIMLVYSLNVLALLMILFGPAYAWARFYGNKAVKLPNIFWLFFGSLAIFIIRPIFRMGRIEAPGLLGVDITTQQIPFIENIWLVLLISALVMGIFYLLGRKSLRKTAKLAFLVTFIYFGMYLYYFFIDLAAYYIDAITIMAQKGQVFIAAHILLFFTITILFYVGGFGMFLYESYFKQKI